MRTIRPCDIILPAIVASYALMLWSYAAPAEPPRGPITMPRNELVAFAQTSKVLPAPIVFAQTLGIPRVITWRSTTGNSGLAWGTTAQITAANAYITYEEGGTGLTLHAPLDEELNFTTSATGDIATGFFATASSAGVFWEDSTAAPTSAAQIAVGLNLVSIPVQVGAIEARLDVTSTGAYLGDDATFGVNVAPIDSGSVTNPIQARVMNTFGGIILEDTSQTRRGGFSLGGASDFVVGSQTDHDLNLTQNSGDGPGIRLNASGASIEFFNDLDSVNLGMTMTVLGSNTARLDINGLQVGCADGMICNPDDADDYIDWNSGLTLQAGNAKGIIFNEEDVEILRITEGTVASCTSAAGQPCLESPYGAILIDDGLEVTDSLIVGSLAVFGGQTTVSNANAVFDILETGASADEGRWRFNADTDTLQIRTVNDAQSGATTFITVTRTGIVVDSISIDATAITLTGDVTITGTCTGCGAGGIGGSTGATDNAVLRADGAGGATLQNSIMTIGDSAAATVTIGGTSPQIVFTNTSTTEFDCNGACNFADQISTTQSITGSGGFVDTWFFHVAAGTFNVTDSVGGNTMFQVFDDGTTGSMKLTGTKSRGQITLSGGSGTATVNSGAICSCVDTSANASVQCAVSATTLTATGTGTDVISYICL